VVAFGGSEPIVALVLPVLQEQVVIVSFLESDSPSASHIEASSLGDLLLEDIDDLGFVDITD